MYLIRNQVPDPFSHAPSYNRVSQCERRASANSWRGRSTLSEAEGVAEPSYKWCRMMESNHRLAIIDRGLDLRANPAWCAVPKLNNRRVFGSPVLPSPEVPVNWWLAMDSNHPRRLYESRVLPTELASHLADRAGIELGRFGASEPPDEILSVSEGPLN